VLLVIDNFDSFTYNLVQYFGQLGIEQRVFRNNEITPQQALALNPDRVLLSRGHVPPAKRRDPRYHQGLCREEPILGVCLGHQSIGHFFGGHVVRAGRLMHGKISPILHRGTDVFQAAFSIPGDPLSFAARRARLAARLSGNHRRNAEGEIMGLRHKTLPVWGVQFHPESIATEHGMNLLRNFLSLN